MKPRTKHIALAVLVFGLYTSGYVWTANRAKAVEVVGDRLSVHADGISLGELLVAVEDMTGVTFKCDEGVAAEKVYVDFEMLPFPEGIKKIVNPWNSAAIYDDAGKLQRVIILERGKDSGLRVFWEGGGSRKTPQTGRSEIGSFTRKQDSKSPGPSQDNSLRKSPAQLNEPPVDKADRMDGPPEQGGQLMKGPPLDRVYVVDGPPDPESGKSEGPPDVGKSNGSDDQGSGDPMDGPPMDRPYEVDGPPGFGQEKVEEGPLGAGNS